MKEFKITEEQIKNIAEGGKIKEMFPEVFGNNLQVGHWYKNLDERGGKILGYVLEINPADKDEFRGYGTSTNGDWVDSDGSLFQFGAFKWRLATDEEVKEVLINEAKKRGFVEGEKIHNIFNSCTDKIRNQDFEYRARKNSLHVMTKSGGYYTIFKNGKWAEVIKETILTKQEAEAKLTELINDGTEYKIK